MYADPPDIYIHEVMELNTSLRSSYVTTAQLSRRTQRTSRLCSLDTGAHWTSTAYPKISNASSSNTLNTHLPGMRYAPGTNKKDHVIAVALRRMFYTGWNSPNHSKCHIIFSYGGVLPYGRLYLIARSTCPPIFCFEKKIVVVVLLPK